LVERVGEDRPGLVGGCVGLHGLVEGALHVQHHRLEEAAGREVHVGYHAWDVVQVLKAHRLGEPARGVDSHHAHPSSLLGGPQGQRVPLLWSCRPRPNRSTR